MQTIKTAWKWCIDTNDLRFVVFILGMLVYMSNGLQLEGLSTKKPRTTKFTSKATAVSSRTMHLVDWKMCQCFIIIKKSIFFALTSIVVIFFDGTSLLMYLSFRQRLWHRCHCIEWITPKVQRAFSLQLMAFWILHIARC